MSAPPTPTTPKPPTLGDSKVTVFKVITSTYADARGNLDIGCLLQWMDIAACLSAEQHCKTSCVTLSMDDLHFHRVVPLGATIRLDAQINKVFGSSMEVGCSVVIEPQRKGVRAALMCSACFIFVALEDGRPVKVAQAAAATLEERFAAALADERKKYMKKRLQLEAEAAAALPAEEADAPPVADAPSLLQSVTALSDASRGGGGGGGCLALSLIHI